MQSLAANFPWSRIGLVLFILITLIQLYYYAWFFQRLAFFRKPEREKYQQHPVSVIICARDEAANLAKYLPGALAQQYSSSNELIVVNHHSQDDTRYLLDEFKKIYRLLRIVNLEYEAKGIPGKKYPLSIGIKEAIHEVVLLTDADCVPASEFWIERMQEGYDEGVEIVLGYSPYRKRPGLLNKLIRFETFHSALQYFSYALAGTPYMGVGRNLSYKKDLFFKNKGFSSGNHLPGGDDDLFINQVANEKNTRIVVDKDSFTVSDPKTTFSEWRRQKTRHYSTGKYYQPKHRFLLGLYAVSHVLFYPAFIFCLIVCPWWWALIVFGIRFITQGVVYYKTMNKLDEADLFPLWWLLDLWMLGYYIIFAPAIWKKAKTNWRV